MSKAKLKKELSTFTGDQLVEVILSAYSASKEAKDYFEFFLNPDIDRLFEKKTEAITKELSRVKWGRCKGRISRIREELRSFAAYGAPADCRIRLLLFTIEAICHQSLLSHLPPTIVNSIAGFTAELLSLSQSSASIETDLSKLKSIADSSDCGTRAMRGLLRQSIESALNSLKK